MTKSNAAALNASAKKAVSMEIGSLQRIRVLVVLCGGKRVSRRRK
eukprot:CAMPEP_0119023764 /NCGR_PEP_ID=MMETSP1176-20130426/30601_1 /TAXON_ID=265551 /ORGANISM="Synedropsis recta cf, Strain CCMP1620" /LENGTH=44 /DNA_ID= /DNA_START= /DNA_END= /DNA_ORIENTATION=